MVLRGWTALAALLCTASLIEGSAFAASVPRFSAAVKLRVGANPGDIVARDLNGDRKSGVDLCMDS